MPDEQPTPDSGIATGPRIDLRDQGALQEWSRKFDATPEQLREAVAAVGDVAADVEMHLKGSHSTTNSERVRSTGQ
jgi:hypothetical protein